MNFLPAYLDSSALLKLVLAERESAALRAALADWPDSVTSQLAAVECQRAVRRVGQDPRLAARMAHVLASCTMLRLDELTLRVAEQVGQPPLRLLDAIHLAAALSVGDLPAVFVTYDDRLAAAARACDLTVISPAAASPASTQPARRPAPASTLRTAGD